MRIGIDASLLRPQTRYTGMGEYTRGLLAGLASIDTPHELLLLGYGERPAGAPERFPWRRVPMLPLGKLGPWASHQVSLGRTARELGLDVLHVTGVYMRISGPGVPLHVPCPLVVTLHDAIPLVYYNRPGAAVRMPWRLRLGFQIALIGVRRAAAVITVSESARDDIIHDAGVDANRLHVVYCGLDFPPRPEPIWSQALLDRLGVPRPYLLYAGSYEPRKNLLGAVAAYAMALEKRDLPPMALLVERESGWQAGVMEEVARSGVAERLHFVHSLSDEEIAALYYNASLFIYPSQYEGFGLPPAQALACGLPVIAARAGSLPEVLGDAAYLIDPESPTELAAAMVRLLDDPSLARELAARGPIQAARYDWEDAARETLRIYEAAGGALTCGLQAAR